MPNNPFMDSQAQQAQQAQQVQRQLNHIRNDLILTAGLIVLLMICVAAPRLVPLLTDWTPESDNYSTCGTGAARMNCYT